MDFNWRPFLSRRQGVAACSNLLLLRCRRYTCTRERPPTRLDRKKTPIMSDKITLQNLSAEQEADRLLAEEDEASRNNVLRDGLQQLEEEENLPPPATQNQTAAVSLQLPHRSPAPLPVAAPPCLPICLP